MAPDVPYDLLARAGDWTVLHRWERSELGRALRRLGLTYGEIGDIVPVPKGTLASWCRHIRLTEEQVAAIRERTGAGSRRGIPVDTQWRRRMERDRLSAESRAEVPDLIADPRWLAGTLLYWAEGSRAKQSLEITNSDPEILRIFIAWVRGYHAMDAAFSMMLHLHEGNDDRDAKRHWKGELGLPDANFHKTFIKPVGTGHRKNHLAWGVCRVRMRRSVDAHLRTLGWIEGLHGRLT